MQIRMQLVVEATAPVFSLLLLFLFVFSFAYSQLSLDLTDYFVHLFFVCFVGKV